MPIFALNHDIELGGGGGGELKLATDQSHDFSYRTTKNSQLANIVSYFGEQYDSS